MSARVEAAAKALADAQGWHAYGVTNNWVSDILAAADAVMFDDAALERAAVVLRRRLGPVLEGDDIEWEMDARAVVAALKGDDQ